MKSVILFISLIVALAAVGSMSLFAGRPLSDLTGSFPIHREAIQEWLCGADGGDCLPAGTPMHVMKEKVLLRVAQTIIETAGQFREVLPGMQAHKVMGAISKLRRPNTLKEAMEVLRPIHEQHLETAKYPYFGFLPNIEGSLIPGGPVVSYSSPCFKQVSVQAVWASKTEIEVTLNATGQKSFLCTDDLVLMGGGVVAFPSLDWDKTFVKSLNVSASVEDPTKLWYLNNRGIKLGRFNKPYLDCIADVISTVTMLGGFAEYPISPATLRDNLQFIQNYIEFSPRMQPLDEKRTSGAIVARDINPDHFQSGDAFFIMRPDGLDPMIGWAEGGTPGHTTMAMRDADNKLHICESTALDSYWPTNGIQCHTWEEWWPLADKAQFNAVHLPLSNASRAKFDVEKAWGWFNKTKGLDYGYSTMLFGWLDLKSGDSPCLPPDFKTCFVEETMELVAILIDDLMGDETKNMFRQGLNHRIGTWPQQMSVLDAIKYGQEKLNYTQFWQLYSIPEQDAWDYNTTLNGKPAVGKSQVCNVFVCNMYKHAGVFDDIDADFNCGEQTLWGVFSLDLYDRSKTGTGRPEICQTTDPNNELCQLMGNFTFHLKPDFNTRTPYKHMGDACPSKGPDYIRPAGC